MTEEDIKNWLLGYAWLGSEEERGREVECIMAQEAWKYIDARIERTVGQAWDPGAEGTLDEATSFELSALYETHDEPHLPTCPRNRA